MVKIASTVTEHEVTTESKLQENSRHKNGMASKKYRYHKKITLENLQKKAAMLEMQNKVLVEQRDRLKREDDELTELVKIHANSCSGILKALLEYTSDN